MRGLGSEQEVWLTPVYLIEIRGVCEATLPAAALRLNKKNQLKEIQRQDCTFC